MKVIKYNTFKTPLECEIALHNGLVLVNNYGYLVSLDEQGNQSFNNPNRNKAYSFDSPYYWRIFGEDGTERYKPSLWSKYMYIISKYVL